MARNALYAPAHRVAPRMPIGSGGQSPDLAPSADAGGTLFQDVRLPWNSANSSTGAAVIGWPATGPMCDFVPATISATAVAASQTPTAGTALTLVSSTGAGITVLSAAFTAFPAQTSIPAGTLVMGTNPTYNRIGTNSITTVYDPTTTIARNVSITSASDDSAATFTVYGYDLYGYAMTETITGANTTLAQGAKAFKWITRIVPAGTLGGGAVTVGFGDKFGLPIQAARASMVDGYWAGAIINGVGTFVAGVTTSPATATTGDVRGTYLPASASNGTRRLTIRVFPDTGLMASQGVQQAFTGVTQA